MVDTQCYQNSIKMYNIVTLPVLLLLLKTMYSHCFHLPSSKENTCLDNTVCVDITACQQFTGNQLDTEMAR